MAPDDGGAVVSGRVRWRPWLGYRHVRELCVDGATVGELLTYSDHVRARYYVATPDDSWRRTFRRRSDAKRWLLARAAGLAEVPRWQRVKRGGVEDGDARRPPPGWRRLMTVEICGDQVSVYERNRRRR